MELKLNNWLITADIHIDDYPQFNYSHRSRLNQFTKLPKRYKEIADQYNCDTLVIAGDMINKPTNRPYVFNVVYPFMKELSSYFNTIYYILGQHDTDSKSNVINQEDSILTTLDFPNFHYMDGKIINFPNGRSVAFKDWTPKQDISWIPNKVDVLFAHYTKSDMFGQEIDESKFDLMIHGDIHNSQEIGKFISIGNPIQHNMSSQQRGTCIIFNPEDCSWERVGIDDNHTRFLRMDYTDDPSEEGFEGELSYHIYKPKRSILKEDKDSKMMQWSEIDDLICKMVEDRGLGTIHGEVIAQNPKFTEIDFNFQLKHLKIHGYRSIVDFEIDFSGGDRIILVGNNGSGKSSIVKALKSVFDSSRHIKEEKSDFTSDLKVELEFFYQNKHYKLWKGTESWGLEIEGKPVSYNNKTEFESDIKIQLPFLKYLDLFFITSDVQNLSSQFTPDRRIELLSRFYRLDRISAYSSTAGLLKEEKQKSFSEINDTVNRIAGRLENISRRLEELSQYAGKDRSDYLDPLVELNTLLENHNKHKEWEIHNKSLFTKVTTLESSLDAYRKRMTLNVSECEELLSTAEKKKKTIQDKLEELVRRSNRLRELTQIRTESYNAGVRLKSELTSLESGICPTCKSKVCNEHTISLGESLKKQIEEQRERFLNTVEEYKTYSQEELDPTFYVRATKQLKDKLSEIEDEILMLNNKINQYRIAHSDYESTKSKYDEAVHEFNMHKCSEPDNVSLPVDFQQRVFSATSELAKYDDYVKELENKLVAESELEASKSQRSEVQRVIDEYQRYILLTNRSGEIMKVILEKMADSFSDSTTKYQVVSGVFRNKPFIRFDSYYKVKSHWRIYETLSDGQKTISDLDFLNKLFSVKVGLLVMDESLKHLDFRMGPAAWELLSDMNVNTIIASTHDANFATFTKKISLRLNDQGHTVCDI